MISMDRLRAAVVGCISMLAPAGVVPVWGKSGYPARVAGVSLVTASVARGPFLRPAEVVERDEATILRWTLTDAVDGRRVGLYVNGARFWIDTAIAATIEESRDAFLERMTTDGGPRALLPGVTITADGTDSIIFDADGVPGLLYYPGVIGPSTMVELEATASLPCESARAVASMVVELQAFTPKDGPSAEALLGTINGGMGLSAACDLRWDLGVSFAGSDEVVNLDSLAGADWRGRASTRWELTMRSYVSRAVDTIESLSMGLIVHNGAEQIEVPVEVES